MCEVLEVSKAGYYRWLNREPSVRHQYNQGLLAFLREVAQQQRGVPGYRKLWKEAVATGYLCSKNRVQQPAAELWLPFLYGAQARLPQAIARHAGVAKPAQPGVYGH